MYNFLFDAFHTVLCGIDLVYNISERFFDEAKALFYRKILEHNSVTSLAEAKQYLRLWNGRNLNSTQRPIVSLIKTVVLKEIISAAESELPELKQKFIASMSRGKPEFIAIIEKDLKHHLEVNGVALKLTNLELDEAEIERLWNSQNTEKATKYRRLTNT